MAINDRFISAYLMIMIKNQKDRSYNAACLKPGTKLEHIVGVTSNKTGRRP
jgi:hypothetical protein